jgi:hypothetical protein
MSTERAQAPASSAPLSKRDVTRHAILDATSPIEAAKGVDG